MTLWFTSDTHFDHTNIIRFCNRPFASAEEMNEALVERWNQVVKPSDHIYHLGDVTMKRDNHGRGLEILKRLTGHKRLIMGNHDHYAMKHYLVHFEKVMAMNRIDDLWFTHVPVHPDNLGSSRANVHGHIHEQPSPSPVARFRAKWTGAPEKELVEQVVPYVNICVEVTGYRPISLEEIQVLVRERIKDPNQVGL